MLNRQYCLLVHQQIRRPPASTILASRARDQGTGCVAGNKQALASLNAGGLQRCLRAASPSPLHSCAPGYVGSRLYPLPSSRRPGLTDSLNVSVSLPHAPHPHMIYTSIPSNSTKSNQVENAASAQFGSGDLAANLFEFRNT